MLRPAELVEKTLSALDIPAAAAGAPRVTVTGTERVHVENHRGLVDYSREELTVATGGFMVRIKGEGLELLAMTDVELVAKGSIWGVELLR